MLRMGCAKVDITPTEPSYLRGYGSRNQLSYGVEEPLEAGAMVLEQDGRRVLILTLDNAGMGVRECEKIYGWIADLGFDINNTYLCCSHTHFAPGISDYYVTFSPEATLAIGHHPAEESYISLLKGRLREAVQKALANVEDVELEEVEIPVPCVSFNRRTIVKGENRVVTNYTYPEDPENYEFQDVDPTLNIWRFKSGDSIKAILGRFSCHPVTGGNYFYKVSADYPGYFQKYISEFFGCPCMFMLGTAGDVVPMRRNGTSRSDIGMVLACAVRLAERRFRKIEDFKLDNCVVEIVATLDKVFPRDKADELFNASMEEAMKTDKPEEFDEKFATDAYRHANSKTFPKDDVPLPIHLLRLGDKVLVGLPFEPMTTVATRLREICPNTVVTSITGGYEGYLPFSYEFARGGYETTMGPQFREGTAEKILEAAIAAVRKMDAR